MALDVHNGECGVVKKSFSLSVTSVLFGCHRLSDLVIFK